MENKEQSMILHIDADAFFVACEVARLPHLRGLPVVVGEERGIVCAMNYEAKALGITRTTPIFKIKKDFPEVIILPSHFELYKEYQDHLVGILRAYFSKVEIYSIDECFIEVEESEIAFTHKAIENLKIKIEEAIGITYTFSLARTKTLAKLASVCAKPNGVKVLRENEEESLLKGTPVGVIWGIGYRLKKRLEILKIYNAHELVKRDDKDLLRNFSTIVVQTKHELLGIKRYYSNENQDQKSLQVTRSFTSTSDITFVLSELSINLSHVCRRLRAMKMVTKHLYLYIKEKGIDVDTKVWHECLLPDFTSSEIVITRSVSSFLERIRRLRKGVYKGTGVWIVDVVREESIIDDLFGDATAARSNEKVLHMMDKLKREYGDTVITTAGSLVAMNKRQRESTERDERSGYVVGLPLPYLGEVS